MKKLYICIILTVFISIHINSNEITIAGSNINSKKNLTKIEFSSVSNNTLNSFRRYGYFGSSAPSNNNTMFLTGLFCTIGGTLLGCGSGVLTYFAAEGLRLFDDKYIAVYFWKDDRRIGWVGLGFGITGIVLGGILVIAGIPLMVLSIIANKRRSGFSKVFIENRGKDETALGISFAI